MASAGFTLPDLSMDPARLLDAAVDAGFTTLFAYWVVIQLLFAIVAVIILVSSIDDAFIDVSYWLGQAGRLVPGFGKRPPAQLRLQRHPEKRIAIMVPAWRESEVIAQMAANTVNTFDYQRYCLFVGVYANDPDTRAEVDRVRARFPNVKLAEVPHDGPTSKADCLNWIVQNIFLHEQATGETFDVFVMHDAEDVVHPFGLKAINWFIDGSGMIQMPVLSMNRRWWKMVACVYMDEFAEFHGKDLPVRSRIARMTPSAGVATAFSREAMLALCAERDNQPYNTDSLTEDYDIGHRLKAIGMRSRFVRYSARTLRYRKAWLRKGQVQVLKTELVATKEFFPDSWSTTVRQKARWMLGVSYLGWTQLGWFGDLANRYFLYRDRKGLFTAPVGAIAYLLVLQNLGYLGLTLFFPELEILPPLVDSAWVEAIIGINLIFLVNRLGHRAWFTLKEHGPGYAWLTPVRAIVANFVGFAAFFRSLLIFVQHLATGKKITWDKTTHAFPSMSEIAHSRGRLGDTLLFWNHLDIHDLDEALAAQKRRYRPIGRLLIDRGAVDDEHLAEAFAERAGAFAAPFDPFAIAPEVLNLLDARLAAEFGATPLRRTGALIEVALREPLDKEAREGLERLLAASGCASVRYVFAPLSDLAFAVRWAWVDDAFARQRETLALLRRLELLDAAGEAAIWRSFRRGYVNLGDRLVRAGALDHNSLQSALAGFWRTPGVRLGEHLVEQGLVDRSSVEAALAAQDEAAFDPLDRALALGLLGPGDAERVRAELHHQETDA